MMIDNNKLVDETSKNKLIFEWKFINEDTYVSVANIDTKLCNIRLVVFKSETSYCATVNIYGRLWKRPTLIMVEKGITKPIDYPVMSVDGYTTRHDAQVAAEFLCRIFFSKTAEDYDNKLFMGD